MVTSPRTPSGWHPAMYRSLEAFLRTLALGSRGGGLLERDGVLALLTPEAPRRSVFNPVIYARPEGLAAARDELARAYAAAGVRAWTVLVPEADRVSARLLEAAGHRLDATPATMAMDLAQLAEPEPGDLDWDDRASLTDLSHVNDLAYGDEPGTFALGLGRPREGAWRLYQARLDGEPASVVGTIDHDGDCGIYFVATLPAAQGRGLARRLLHLALAGARDRGCTTTTLQATRIGRAVYERIGYRDLGVLEMWEHRS